jgi:hypothetical protein
VDPLFAEGHQKRAWPPTALAGAGMMIATFLQSRFRVYSTEHIDNKNNKGHILVVNDGGVSKKP